MSESTQSSGRQSMTYVVENKGERPLMTGGAEKALMRRVTGRESQRAEMGQIP